MNTSDRPRSLPTPFLEGWRRDERALLLRLGSLLTDDDLAEIARGDYDEFRGQNMDALRSLRSSGNVPPAFDPIPGEALRSCRYLAAECGDEGRDDASARRTAQAHRIRAFGGAATCIAYGQSPGTTPFPPLADLLALLESLDALGIEADRDGEALLAWLIHRLRAEDEPVIDAFLGIGLLRFVAADSSRPDAVALAILDWVMACGDAHASWLRDGYGAGGGAHWPSGDTHGADLGAWAAYVDRLANRMAGIRGARVAEGTSLLATAIHDGAERDAGR